MAESCAFARLARYRAKGNEPRENDEERMTVNQETVSFSTANKHAVSLSEVVERDLRLDLFRGIGLWMVFLDHIPHDVVAWLTLRNYGFSDAAEFFVFISGYLAGFIYGPIIGTGYLLAATKRLWTRAGQMYVAHIM